MMMIFYEQSLAGRVMNGVVVICKLMKPFPRRVSKNENNKGQNDHKSLPELKA